MAYYYLGSLTTPTCDEVVNWIVRKDVQPMTNAEYLLFTSKEINNYRLTQPLNGRNVTSVQLSISSVASYSVCLILSIIMLMLPLL